MENRIKSVQPSDLVVVVDFGRGPQIFTNAKGILGEEAGNALLEWQHNSSSHTVGSDERREKAAQAFERIAGFCPEAVEKAEEEIKSRIGAQVNKIDNNNNS